MATADKFRDYLDAIQRNDLDLTRKSYCDEFLNKLDKNDFNGLLYACNLGHVDIARFLLDKHADIELPCPYNGWRALHWAVGNGHEKVGELLLDRGAQIESRTSKGMHPLHCAGLADHLDAVRMLLIRGANPEARTNTNENVLEISRGNEADKTVAFLNRWIGYTQVFHWVRQRNLEAVRGAFLKERLLVKEDQTGMSVLDVAVQSEAHSCLEYMFLEGLGEHDIISALSLTLARLNVTVDQFRSQLRLHDAILFERTAPFEEHATMWNINRAWILTGESWLELCSRHRRSTFVRRVMEMALDTDPQAWQRAIDHASMSCVSIATQIRSRQAFLANRVKAGYNRLHVAVQDNNIEVIRYILDNGIVDPNISIAALGTPLCLALSLGHMEAVRAFRDYGIDVNKPNQFNQTPLHIALENQSNDETIAFLRNISHVDHKDCYGFTALHLAVINNESEVCGHLIELGADMLMPLRIHQGNHMNRLFMSAIIPMGTEENPLTISLKLHRTILNSMMPHVTPRMCHTLTEDGNSLLHISAKLLVPLITRFLIEKGSKVNITNKEGNTPIHSLFLESMENICEMEGFIETLETLVNHGADINLLNNHGISAFRCALETNSRNTLNLVLSNCHTVVVRPEDVFTLYQRQWPDLLKAVLDLQDPAFKRQLMLNYITESQQELFEFILELSSEEFISFILQEFLLLSATLKQKMIFDLLMQYPIKEAKMFDSGETLLTSMIKSSDEDYCLELVKSEGGEVLVDVKNQRSDTALHGAAARGFMKLFKALLLQCENIAELSDGLTPLQLLMTTVCRSNDKKKIGKLETIVKMMIKQGMDAKQFTELIPRCTNPALHENLEKYYQKMRKTSNENEDEDSLNQCEICVSNKIDCQLGCGHPFCKECMSRVQACPKCRQPKQRVLPLYLP